MNFHEAEQYLLSLGNEVLAMKLGLENVSKLLAALGNPQENYLKVQVAGTNGKGSVCAFLESICLHAGIKTGVTTSPHLISMTERVRIGGEDISEEAFAALATRVREVSEQLVTGGEVETVPTYFEQVTAIALLAFAEAKVELAILETGLGGRLDATTAAKAEICAITRIDYDHQKILGETLEEIAAEKAAIITKDTEYVVIGAQTRPVMALLRKHCRELGKTPINDGYEPWWLRPNEDGTVKAGFVRLAFSRVRLGLTGKHQIENAQTALWIAEALHLRGVFDQVPNEEDELEARIVEGLKNATHPGRLEWVGQFLLDGAHNVGGATALRDYLNESVGKPITLIFGAMRDKDVSEIAAVLFPLASTVILTKADNPRSMPPEELMPIAEKFAADVRTANNVDEALHTAEDISSADGVILVTGSLYLVGEARKVITQI